MSSDLSALPFQTNLEILARQVVEGFITGLHKSPFHGFSVEFAEHRLYNPGDNVRHIDWKRFAKTDKLFSKRYEEETNLRCQLVLDTSSSMYYPDKNINKLRFSVESAAALMYMLKKQRDAFGLSLFSDALHLHTAAKSTLAHQKYLFSKLEEVLQRPSGKRATGIAPVLHQIAESTHQRALIIIFSDLLPSPTHTLDAFFSALQHLKFNKHEVILFNVLDRATEMDFDFPQRAYQFVDMESGQVLKAHTAAIKAAYFAEMKAYQQHIQERCAQYKIDLVEADIRAGYGPVLQRYLIKRQKMKG